MLLKKEDISAGERRQVAGGVKKEAGRLSLLVSNGLKKREGKKGSEILKGLSLLHPS